MAFGQEIYNLIPNEGYMLVHAIEIILGLYIFWMAWQKGEKMRKAAIFFLLYAIIGLVNLLTHFGTFTLAFTHLVDTVLLLVGVILLMLGMKDM